jgi:hypothetical protein
MTELKPCPFCGAIPKITTLAEGMNWICCENDKCKIQPCTDWHKNLSVIVREWNRRKEGEQK